VVMEMPAAVALTLGYRRSEKTREGGRGRACQARPADQAAHDREPQSPAAGAVQAASAVGSAKSAPSPARVQFSLVQQPMKRSLELPKALPGERSRLPRRAELIGELPTT
jgi:hypothetical protein